MAWIESHVDIGEHPKIAELCLDLGLRKFEAVGILHLLWHFTMKYAWRDGDLRRFTSRAICKALDWDKDPDVLIKALTDAGWLEKDKLVIHDWFDYCGKLVTDRLYNEERRKTSSRFVNARKKSATLPNPTLPNQKKRNICAPKLKFQKPTPAEIEEYAQSIGFKLNGSKFWNYYEAKGWLVGRSPMKDWKAAVRTWRSNGFDVQPGMAPAAPVDPKKVEAAAERMERLREKTWEEQQKLKEVARGE